MDRLRARQKSLLESFLSPLRCDFECGGGWRPLGRHRLYQFSAPNYSKTSDTAYIQNIAIIHSYRDILVGL